MKLKNYQKRVLRNLDDFMNLLNSTQSIEKAYTRSWELQNVRVGFEKMPPYNNNVLPGVPHVCFKVPTGGGKTLLACASLRHIFDGLGLTRRRAVVWLVPSNSILEQTIRNLQNPEHDYRRQIDFDFSSRVEVYNGEQALNGQALSPSSVEENLSIFVLSYDALRITRKEGRRIYKENGNLAQFVPHYPDRGTLVPEVDESALIQVLNQLSPVVIVDESHNAQSDLSVEMLKNLNPSFVLDLTATPKNNSNIISIVNAWELKTENMVKLPVVIYNRRSKDDVLFDALNMRRLLEAAAKEEFEEAGSYIRPIILFQAQPKGKENAATFEQLKRELMDAGIPEDQIAIKTAEINELKHTNLLSPECPIRYIITVNALKEGWDCPFAYILATLANRTSKVDVEQIVGRVLRLPYVKKHRHDELNMSYVITSSVHFRETVDNVVKGLNQAGFTDKDYRVGDPAPETPEEKHEQTVINPPAPEETEEEFVGFDTAAIRARMEQQRQAEENGEQSAASIMLQEAERQGKAFDEEMQKAENMGLPITGGSEMRDYYEMQNEYAEDALSLKLPIFYETVGLSMIMDDKVAVTKESLSEGFTLADKDTQINFNMTAGDVAMLDVDDTKGRPYQVAMSVRKAQQLSQYVRSCPPEKRKEECVNQIYKQMNRLDYLSADDLKKYIRRIVEQMSSDEVAQMESSLPSYAYKIKKKIESLLDVYREKLFMEKIVTQEITVEPFYHFPKGISPTSTMLPISKQLYTDEEDVNDFERRVIMAIAGLDNIRWWHRNIDRQDFCLNGFINHYPDFIVRTVKGNIVLVETKGDDRDNSDSKAKLRLGLKWQELAGKGYQYFMVFDEKETGFEGAYRFGEFLDILIKL
ncbi:MAG: DEAD/DEAH box helicase family protein [Clostridia bacterium]|nr:DEAD/DEAH box helicase family protein [Clostridia bacterium]